MTAEELTALPRDLEFASLLVVRKTYEAAHARCALTNWSLRTPRNMQELVASWKVLRKRAKKSRTRPPVSKTLKFPPKLARLRSLLAGRRGVLKIEFPHRQRLHHAFFRFKEGERIEVVLV